MGTREIYIVVATCPVRRRGSLVPSASSSKNTGGRWSAIRSDGTGLGPFQSMLLDQTSESDREGVCRLQSLQHVAICANPGAASPAEAVFGGERARPWRALRTLLAERVPRSSLRGPPSGEEPAGKQLHRPLTAAVRRPRQSSWPLSAQWVFARSALVGGAKTLAIVDAEPTISDRRYPAAKSHRI
jgi:hypothetical protein